MLSRARPTEQGEQAIAGYGLPLLGPRFYTRADFSHAMTTGETAVESTPSGKAAARRPACLPGSRPPLSHRAGVRLMAKKPAAAFQLPADEEDRSAVAPASTIEPAPAKAARELPEYRKGKKNLSVWIDERAFRQFKAMAARDHPAGIHDPPAQRRVRRQEPPDDR